jgi:hypothetical protein
MLERGATPAAQATDAAAGRTLRVPPPASGTGCGSTSAVAAATVGPVEATHHDRVEGLPADAADR